MRIPRALIVKHPMGRPLGAAGDTVRQHEVLDAAMNLLESATVNNTVIEFPHEYRPNPKRR